jgi:flagellar biosynthetic protein FliP
VRRHRRLLLAGLVGPGMLLGAAMASAQAALPSVALTIGGGEEGGRLSANLQIVLLLTVLSLAPAILIALTAFVRIVIVLSFLRHAVGTPSMPPNQVIVSLALFLTTFVMLPVFRQIHRDAVEPYLAEEMEDGAALAAAYAPLREFMLRQTREKDLALFAAATGAGRPEERAAVPAQALIPAFMISELKTAFQMGFLLFIPFLILDMVVASVLTSMGMITLPPVLISLPFKLMLFVLVDGWNLLVGSLVQSFR